MKKLIVLSIICFSLTIGCKNDDDVDSLENILYSNWSLVKISGGFTNTSYNFDVGTILWTFNESSQTLIVANNNDNEMDFSGLESGEYNFEIRDNLMYIGESNLGTIELSLTHLKIDHRAADGHLYEFERYGFPID